MTNINVRYEFNPPLGQLTDELRRGLERGLLRAALHVEGAAKDNVTPFTRTGRLRSSITHALDAGKLTATIGTKVSYAPHVEFGTRPHTITPKRGKVLAFPSGRTGTGRGSGSTVFAKSVKHPGFKGHRYMQRALESSRNEVIALLQQSIQDAL